MRAIHSLERNKELRTVIDTRIERAESRIRGYLLGNGLDTVDLAGYHVSLGEAGELRVMPDPEWVAPSVRQLPLPRPGETVELALVTSRTTSLVEPSIASQSEPRE